MTVPATRLLVGEGVLGDCAVGSYVLWQRKRVRLLPPRWNLDNHLHIVGREWKDDGTEFRVTGLVLGEDGVRVEYAGVTNQGGMGETYFSTLDEVERWLKNDFEDPDHEDGESGRGEGDEGDEGGDGDDHVDQAQSRGGDGKEGEEGPEEDSMSGLIPKHALDVDYGDDIVGGDDSTGDHHDHDWENEIELRKSKANDDHAWETVRVKLDAVLARPNLKTSPY